MSDKVLNQIKVKLSCLKSNLGMERSSLCNLLLRPMASQGYAEVSKTLNNREFLFLLKNQQEDIANVFLLAEDKNLLLMFEDIKRRAEDGHQFKKVFSDIKPFVYVIAQKSPSLLGVSQKRVDAVFSFLREINGKFTTNEEMIQASMKERLQEDIYWNHFLMLKNKSLAPIFLKALPENGSIVNPELSLELVARKLFNEKDLPELLKLTCIMTQYDWSQTIYHEMGKGDFELSDSDLRAIFDCEGLKPLGKIRDWVRSGEDATLEGLNGFLPREITKQHAQKIALKDALIFPEMLEAFQKENGFLPFKEHVSMLVSSPSRILNQFNVLRRLSGFKMGEVMGEESLDALLSSLFFQTREGSKSAFLAWQEKRMLLSKYGDRPIRRSKMPRI